MNKEKIYFMAGTACIVTGAYYIHWGLAIIVCGIGVLVGSYAEYCDKQLKADVDKVEKDRTNLEECRKELEEITHGVQNVIEEFNDKYESMWRERNFDTYYIYKMRQMEDRMQATLSKFAK